MDRIELLTKYLEKSPEDSFLLHALALEYVKKGRMQDAINLWEKVLAGDPGYVGSYYHLGKALEAIGQEERAVEVFASGIAVAKQQGETKAQSELQQALDELS